MLFATMQTRPANAPAIFAVRRLVEVCPGDLALDGWYLAPLRPLANDPTSNRLRAFGGQIHRGK
jgi:hypothetical protein